MALPCQPHESVLRAAAHLPEGTGELCPEEWSIEACDLFLFDLAHGSLEGLEAIAVC
jgi:hypothetical protein